MQFHDRMELGISLISLLFSKNSLLFSKNSLILMNTVKLRPTCAFLINSKQNTTPQAK